MASYPSEAEVTAAALALRDLDTIKGVLPYYERLATAALRAAAEVRERTHVLVPREPSEKMIKAGLNYRFNTILGGENTRETDTASLYRAMINTWIEEWGEAQRKHTEARPLAATGGQDER